MNYIIDGNIDFYAELYNGDAELYNGDAELYNGDAELYNGDDCIVSINKDICLLTREPLTSNYISLPCSHRFNYIPLYNEIKEQKKKSLLETMSLDINQIKCPYCRKKVNNLIPYVRCDGVEKIKGVNDPSKYCMFHLKCSWKFETGENKDSICNSSGYTSEFGDLCDIHWKISNNRNNKKINKINTWTNVMDRMHKTKKLFELREILKKNKLRIGGTKKELVRRIIENKLY
jgi:hypothetical protein